MRHRCCPVSLFETFRAFFLSRARGLVGYARDGAKRAIFVTRLGLPRLFADRRRYHADIAPLPRVLENAYASGGGGVSTEGDVAVEREAEAEAEGKWKARYRPINWGEFRLKRFAGDYADQGTDEVQISHYLLQP